ncbi:hypothetical protein [Mucilaginibacter aquariorum]|uniref:NnrS family protein n=1 Tax=Mucilaginibacter aquariorum TaxID=2967225 RepID=A0ABT1T3R3_9SPHI|nr:hypothetical protein [Mucilaginibacter aquariorum]MCQ6959250.1 hypothetical protein [Mucilaginibacter aquariorum]
MARLPNLNYARLAVLNFIVLSIWGLALRYMQLGVLPFNYQYLLHAHSHFAFSGWMFLTITYLLARLCCGQQLNDGFRHVLLAAQVSAWGMLVSFSWQGYKIVSISFSSLFVIAGFRLAYLVIKNPRLRSNVNSAAFTLIRGAMILLCLSALGPFALGPLSVLGLKAGPWYQDAIYFYLHFQMNGFMELAALGLLAANLPLERIARADLHWFRLFLFSTLPLFFIFTLWAQHGIWAGILAGAGAALNLLSWLAIMHRHRKHQGALSFLQKVALLALTIKCLLQLAVCIPLIGDWAFLNRNLIIGYIHLLTLGILMPLLIEQLAGNEVFRSRVLFVWLKYIYVTLAAIYLALLFLQPLLALWGISVPHYQPLLFWLCAAFLLFGIGLFTLVKQNNNPRI